MKQTGNLFIVKREEKKIIQLLPNNCINNTMIKKKDLCFHFPSRTLYRQNMLNVI